MFRSLRGKSNAFAFGELLFFGRAQRKVTKRKGAFPIKAHPPNECRRDFSKGHPCPLEKRRTSCAAPSGSMGDVAAADLQGQQHDAPAPALAWLVTHPGDRLRAQDPEGAAHRMCAVFSRAMDGESENR